MSDKPKDPLVIDEQAQMTPAHFVVLKRRMAETARQQFMEEVERRAGATREEMLEGMFRQIGAHRATQIAAVVWLRRILGQEETP